MLRLHYCLINVAASGYTFAKPHLRATPGSCQILTLAPSETIPDSAFLVTLNCVKRVREEARRSSDTDLEGSCGALLSIKKQSDRMKTLFLSTPGSQQFI